MTTEHINEQEFLCINNKNLIKSESEFNANFNWTDCCRSPLSLVRLLSHDERTKKQYVRWPGLFVRVLAVVVVDVVHHHSCPCPLPSQRGKARRCGALTKLDVLCIGFRVSACFGGSLRRSSRKRGRVLSAGRELCARIGTGEGATQQPWRWNQSRGRPRLHLRRWPLWWPWERWPVP